MLTFGVSHSLYTFSIIKCNQLILLRNREQFFWPSCVSLSPTCMKLSTWGLPWGLVVKGQWRECTTRDTDTWACVLVQVPIAGKPNLHLCTLLNGILRIPRRCPSPSKGCPNYPPEATHPPLLNCIFLFILFIAVVIVWFPVDVFVHLGVVCLPCEHVNSMCFVFSDPSRALSRGLGAQ